LNVVLKLTVCEVLCGRLGFTSPYLAVDEGQNVSFGVLTVYYQACTWQDVCSGIKLL
jgi:hypothetical protein